MFKGQPKGLFALALSNAGERFGYYTMLAIFTLYMRAKFGWDENESGQVYAIFLAGLYFMPLFGGMIADKIGYGKCVSIGSIVMILGYIALSIGTKWNPAFSMNGMYIALAMAGANMAPMLMAI